MKKTRQKMKRKIMFLSMVCFAMIILCSCGKEEKGGDSVCVVELNNMIPEFENMPENVKENIEIIIYIENIVTEKETEAILTRENNFQKKIYLSQGKYRVTSVFLSGGPKLANMELDASREIFSVNKDEISKVEAYITNVEEFTEWLLCMSIKPEIMQTGTFSQRVQFEGNLIELKNIKSYVDFSYDAEIRPYDKITLKNDEKGVSITIQNQSDVATSWENCEIIEVSFDKNNVIFGQGIYIGIDVKDVMHKEKGILGVPDKMFGTVLMGINYDDTEASYIDDISGDKLTFLIRGDGEYISAITYAFEVFE